MSRRLNRESLFRAVREVVLAAVPDVRAIYVYGSFARGEDGAGSDLDVAVLMPPGRTIPDTLDLQARLSGQAGREVDLLDLQRANDVIRTEVLRDGALLYTDDPDALLAWEAYALSRHARHREEIAAIVAQFRESGIAYASRP